MSICPICKTHHETTACPVEVPVVPDTPQPVQVGTVTLNGLSFGEQLIVEKLELIIMELQNLSTIVARK